MQPAMSIDIQAATAQSSTHYQSSGDDPRLRVLTNDSACLDVVTTYSISLIMCQPGETRAKMPAGEVGHCARIQRTKRVAGGQADMMHEA